MLEVNAIPGLTETSLLPQAAEAAGIGVRRADRRGCIDARRWLSGPAAPPGPERHGRIRRYSPAREVLGRDLVEEVLELLDDLLGVLDLVLELDRRLGDHVVGGEDRRAGADGQRERVARARVDLELAPVDAEA